MENRKSKFTIVFVSFTALLLLIGCSKEDNLTDYEGVDEIQNDLVLEAIISWGFPKDAIEDKGDYYVVDGDIAFSKNQKYASRQLSDAKQRRHNNLVTLENINVYLDPRMNFDWRNASIQAINRWNAINSGINLNIRTSIANAHVQIMYDSHDPNVYLKPNAFGRGSWPLRNGLPGKKIWINPDFDSTNRSICNKPITRSMRIANVQHELGHNLGITHTNDSFGSLIPGTPNTDFQSVMNGGSPCEINDFSTGDIAAILYLFPQPGLLQMKSWAHQQGGFWDDQIWVAGDFNGDGKDDFANIFSDNGLTSIDVHISTGNSFSIRRWTTRKGGNYGSEQWVVGDFNGDGKDDIGYAFPDATALAHFAVHVSNGSSFSLQHWGYKQGGMYGTETWMAGDFNGDGKDDIAKVFPENGYSSLDVHISNGNNFSIQRWATRKGGNYGNEKWGAGDFNGDGKDDIGYAFPDGNSQTHLAVHVSNGNKFSLEQWGAKQGGFWGEQKWMTGDFNGDGKDEFAKVFQDDSRASFDVHLANGNQFSMERWATRQGGMYGKEKWAVGDFNGDGYDDFTKSFNNGGSANIDVHFKK